MPTDEPIQTDKPDRALYPILVAVLGLLAAVGFVISLSAVIKSYLTEIPRPATQSPVQELTITSELSISRASGTFRISGMAADLGTICTSGEVYDLRYQDISPSPDELTALIIEKQFVCSDGSGSFDMILNVQISESGTTGTWRIVGGDGVFEGLRGTGDLTGSYQDEDIIIDTFVGTVSVD